MSFCAAIMELYIFVIILVINSKFNLSHCDPIKIIQRNNDVNQQTLFVSTSSSNKSNNSGMGPVKVLEAPLKSKYDKKSYRLLRLSNGLTALLVSTQSNVNKARHESIHPKKSACNLRIDVGSFSNPRDVQGLAHFVGNFEHFEHLLFSFLTLFDFNTFEM